MKRRRRNSGGFAIILVLCTLFFVLAINIGNLNVKSDTLNEKEQRLLKQIEVEEQKNKNLKAQMDERKTKKYIEQIAREKLGLVNPNEIIFKEDNE